MEEQPFQYTKKSGIPFIQQAETRRAAELKVQSYSSSYSSSNYRVTSYRTDSQSVEFSVDGVTGHLRDPEGWKAFREFLAYPTQQYEQALDFWQAVENLDANASDVEKMHRIGVIADRYVNKESQHAINLSERDRDRFFTWLGVPDESHHVLKELQRSICQQLRDKLLDYMESQPYLHYTRDKARASAHVADSDSDENEVDAERRKQQREEDARQRKLTEEQTERMRMQYAYLVDTSSDDDGHGISGLHGNLSSCEDAAVDSSSGDGPNLDSCEDAKRDSSEEEGLVGADAGEGGAEDPV
jgi:hypothetical protein